MKHDLGRIKSNKSFFESKAVQERSPWKLKSLRNYEVVGKSLDGDTFA